MREDVPAAGWEWLVTPGPRPLYTNVKTTWYKKGKKKSKTEKNEKSVKKLTALRESQLSPGKMHLASREIVLISNGGAAFIPGSVLRDAALCCA